MQPRKPLDAADKAKGVLAVSSKLFLLPTRNDDKKKVKSTQIWCVWNMRFSGFGGVKKQRRRYYNVLTDAKHEVL